jgi:hypothetical protein
MLSYVIEIRFCFNLSFTQFMFWFLIIMIEFKFKSNFITIHPNFLMFGNSFCRDNFVFVTIIFSCVNSL